MVKWLLKFLWDDTKFERFGRGAIGAAGALLVTPEGQVLVESLGASIHPAVGPALVGLAFAIGAGDKTKSN